MMIRRVLIVMAAAFSAAACAGKEIEHASVAARASHNELYTVSAEPVMVDGESGWLNIKLQIKSELGTDSVAFNMIIK